MSPGKKSVSLFERKSDYVCMCNSEEVGWLYAEVADYICCRVAADSICITCVIVECMINRIAISHQAMAVHHGHGVVINQRIKMRKSILKKNCGDKYANEQIFYHNTPKNTITNDVIG